jgi:hypothetical protein
MLGDKCDAHETMEGNESWKAQIPFKFWLDAGGKSSIEEKTLPELEIQPLVRPGHQPIAMPTVPPRLSKECTGKLSIFFPFSLDPTPEKTFGDEEEGKRERTNGPYERW